MAAELRLNVALDLQYFKRQLPKLSQAAAGFQLPIQVKLDGKQLQRELNKLTGRREFRINLNDQSIKSAIDNVKTLKRELDGLERRSRSATAAAAPIGKTQLSKTTGQGGFSAAEIQALYQQAASQGVAGFQKGIKLKRADAVAELSALSADAVKGLILGLRKGQGGVKDAAAGLSDALVDSMEQRLGIRSPSFRLMKTGEYAAEGFEIGLTAGLKEAESSAVKQMQSMLRALQGEAAKFGPALLMASGMSGGQGGQIRNAALMAAGMGGLFTPETEMQRERRQINERISAQYGSSPTATFQGGAPTGRFSFGAKPASVYGGVPRQQLALPSSEMMEAGRTMKQFAQVAAEAQEIIRKQNDIARRRAANAERAASQGRHFSDMPSGGSGGGGGGGGRPVSPFGRGVPNFPSLPGAGAVRELASEFGNATKQVLLFGTAYKGLAFFMDFPSQVGEAVGALQSFNNTLNAISPSAEAAADSNAFILDIVNRYNVPLQSARDGFTKLYASMSPAGFEGDQIKDIFLGISQAAATFGMSADKVDRMNYAFAQMASKGQIMSEELKGQLGDVLPGAMGIFAEAAGLKGPQAIQKFSKALEDGAFKGENMVALLKNVGQVMQSEFGPGAEGAARTFQGVMNRLQNSMKLLYEAFEPVAVQFLNSVVVPMTQGVKTITDGISAYFSKTKASTKEGQAFADQLKSLESTFNGIKTNVMGVVEVFKQFSAALLPVLQTLLQIAGNPVVGYLARLYAIVLPLNMAFGAMRGLMVATNVQLLIFKARVLMGTKSLTAFRGMMAMTGASAATTAASIRGVGVAMKAALGSTVVGAIVVGLGILIEKIVTLRARMDEVKRAAQEASAAIQHMGRAEAVQAKTQAEQDLVTLRGLRQRSKGKYTHIATSEEEKAALERAGVSTNKFKDRSNGGGAADGVMGQAIDRALGSAGERLTTARDRVIALDKSKAEEDAALQAQMEAISLAGTSDGGGGKDQSDSAAILAIKQKIAAEEQGILMNAQGYNELNLIRLEQELRFQEIAEMNANEATKAQLREEAKVDSAKKYKAVFDDLAKAVVKEGEDQKRALKQQEQSRAALAGIILDAKLSSGEISEEEHKTAKFLLEQEATRRRILEMPGLTQEERDAGIAAVDGMKPPEEQGKISEWIEKTEEEINDFEGMATSAADGIASEFGNAFSSILQGTTSIQEGLGNAFKNIGSMFADMVMQMLAKWAMLQVMKGLFPGMADGGVVNASSGGGLVDLVPKPFATGGVVTGPTLAMVGEGRFNEAVVPLPNGKSIPVEMNGGGAGNNVSTNITVNVNNGQVSSKKSGSQGNDLARNLEGAVKQVIMREMQPGGMISSGR